MPNNSRTTLWPSLGLVLASGLLVGLPLHADGFALNPLWLARQTLPAFTVALGLGLALRLILHRARHRAWPRPGAGRLAREAAELLGAWFLLLAMVGIYCWGKLLIPWFRPLTYDAQVYAVERAVHAGIDPGAFVFAALAGAPWADAVLDWTYAQYSLVLLAIVGWHLSDPDADARNRWLRGFVMLWLGGLAVYWLLPAHGPAFVFPDLGPSLAIRYPIAFATQAALMENYRNLEALLGGGAAVPLRLEYGIAAFPSLHVAVPAHAFFIAMERRHPARGPLLLVTLLFVVGSVATGWHYLVDAWAGIAMAAACWLALRRARPLPTDP